MSAKQCGGAAHPRCAPMSPLMTHTKNNIEITVLHILLSVTPSLGLNKFYRMFETIKEVVSLALRHYRWFFLVQIAPFL